MTVKILVKYPSQALDKPVLAEVIRKTTLGINILRATVDSLNGEILLGVDGSKEEIENLIESFRQSGVEAEEIKRTVRLDEECCVSCGACISLCPTKALRMGKDYSVKLDEEKCVLCEACIPACPVKALKTVEL